MAVFKNLRTAFLFPGGRMNHPFKHMETYMFLQDCNTSFKWFSDWWNEAYLQNTSGILSQIFPLES